MADIVKTLEDALEVIKKQKEEIERLEEELEIKSQKRANIFEIADAFERGRRNAINEFAARAIVEHNGIDKPIIEVLEVFEKIEKVKKEMLRCK